MTIKPSTGRRNVNLLDSYIHTAYDKVVKVADYLDLIVAVAGSINHSMKYLGASDVPPTSRVDGTDMENGDYYLDTSVNFMRYYSLNETKWVDIDPARIVEVLEEINDAKEAAEEAMTLAQQYADSIRKQIVNHALPALSITGSVNNTYYVCTNDELTVTLGEVPVGTVIYVQFTGSGQGQYVPDTGFNIIETSGTQINSIVTTAIYAGNNNWTLVGEFVDLGI